MVRKPLKLKRRKKKSLFKRFLRLVVFSLLVIVILFSGTFFYFYVTSNIVRDTTNLLLSGAVNPQNAFPDSEEISFLLLGRDLDRDPQGNIVKSKGRTDTVMFVHVNFRDRSMNVLSIPRDTLVRIPGYSGKHRINTANALGGPELAVKTVHSLLGVKPDYYILVNFDGFEKAIDTIGGLKVNVDKKLDYDDNWGNLHIHLNPGSQVLSGEQAMGFARYRKSNDGRSDSDFTRIGRQQELVAAMRGKLSNPLALIRFPGAIDKIREDMDGTLSTAQILSLAWFARSLPSGEGIKMETLPALEGGGSFVLADKDATRKLIERMLISR